MTSLDWVAVVVLVMGVGLILVAPYASPPGGLYMSVQEVEESSVPDDTTIAEYKEFSPEMQEVFDEARREGSTHVGTVEPDWFTDARYVRNEGANYELGGSWAFPARGNTQTLHILGLILVALAGLYVPVRVLWLFLDRR